MLAGVIIVMAGENKFSRFNSMDVRKGTDSLTVNYIKEHPVAGAGIISNPGSVEYQDKKMTDVTRPADAPPSPILTISFGRYGAVWNSRPVSALDPACRVGVVCFKSRSYLLQLYMLIYLLFMLIRRPVVCAGRHHPIYMVLSVCSYTSVSATNH